LDCSSAKVLPLQPADVGVGDQLAGAGDGVSVTGLADVDGRHDVADVFEIDLRLEHADDVTGEPFDGT
jgi:hypothetical protein